MKNILLIICISAIILSSAPLFADYRADIQEGNAAYKAGEWSLAAEFYKSAYVEKPSPVLKKFLDTARLAAYKQAVAKGNAAYKINDNTEALKNYNYAYSLYPVKQLSSIIQKLGGNTFANSGNKDGTGVFLLVTADVVLGIGTIVTGAIASGGVSDYKDMYSQINNTDQDSYQALLNKKSSVESSQSMFGIITGLTAAALVYTCLDMFVLHTVFPKDTAFGIENRKNQFALILNKEF